MVLIFDFAKVQILRGIKSGFGNTVTIYIFKENYNFLMNTSKFSSLPSLLSFVLSGAFLFLGCSTDGDSTDGNLNIGLLLGSWQNVEACPDSNDGISFLTENQFFSETSDNSGICEFDASCGISQSGTYSITGNEISYSNVTTQSIDYNTDDDSFCVVDSDGTTGERFEIEELTSTTLTIVQFDTDDGSEPVFTGSVTYTKLE